MTKRPQIHPRPTPSRTRRRRAEGQPVAGTIDAPNVEQAQRLLQNLRLRVLQIEPAPTAPRRAPKPLNGEDFLSFNQQLTHLTTAGLPIEHGLRLIAQDMRTGRLRATVQQVASGAGARHAARPGVREASRQVPAALRAPHRRRRRDQQPARACC